MPYSEDYAFIGGYSSGGNSGILNIERRYISSSKENFDNDVVDNETETDVDFMIKLYRNSHPNYFLGSWIIKPIIEILLHYMSYPRVTSKDDNLARRLNEIYETKRSSFLQLFRELGLFGEEYCLIGFDADLNMPTIKPKNKSFVIETRYEDFNNSDRITYIAIKEYAEQVNKDTLEKEQIVFIKTYWLEENSEYKKLAKKSKEVDSEKRYKYYGKIEKKADSQLEVVKDRFEIPWDVIPVEQFHQNRLSNDGVGYSDVNGLIKLCQVYHQVFESMIDTNIYNSKPTMIFSGLSDAEEFVKSTYGAIDPVTNQISQMGSYELFGSYYLEGAASASYLSVDNTYVESAKEILRLLFYIFVQTSNVPEWALGAHIDGSYASTKMQSTPLIQKIESKRMDVNDPLVNLNVKLAKIMEANEGKKLFSTYITQLEWPSPLPEDRDYILSVIDKIIPLEVLTDEKILELLDIVSNPDVEIKKKKKQMKKEALAENVDAQKLIQGVMKKLGKTNDGAEEKLDDENDDSETAAEMNFDDNADIDDILMSLFGEDYIEVLGFTNS